MPTHHMLIDGRLIGGAATLPVVDPATEEVFAHAPDCSAEELDQAIDAARRAFPAWRSTDIEKRRALLAQMASRIGPHVAALAESLTREQGKPTQAALRELDSTLRFMKGQCELQLPELVNEDTPTRRSITSRVPIGVVAALAPWNFPVLLAWWKVIPALLAGNTIVLKPSPLTPLTVLRIGELLADLLPPGVLNVISGGDNLGPLLTAHTGVDKVSFTGSTQTGKRVMESAAGTLKRLTLELGGNDAAIVLPDVDVERLVPTLFWSAFTNSGQVCIASKRVYLPRERYDEIAQAFVAYARTVKVGPGLAPDSQLGPVQNRRQYERVRELVEHSRREGLRVLFEGEAPAGPGYFIPVTLFDNPPESSRVVAEEPFGPVLPLLSYDTLEDAITRANASPYGLAGSVWGSDEAQALAVASRLETGTVWINEPMYLAPNAAFAGHKQSGLGVEHGAEGLLGFTEPQTIVLRRA
ncbi:MAG TPA: aldehyde dehydrogenase family protein [Albitalea sp.]|nr:aldehyde dehydrogenase family protein [Albitalea sp.]